MQQYQQHVYYCMTKVYPKSVSSFLMAHQHKKRLFSVLNLLSNLSKSSSKNNKWQASKENTTYLFIRRRKVLSAETASCVLVIIASRCKIDRLTVKTSFAILTQPYTT